METQSADIPAVILARIEGKFDAYHERTDTILGNVVKLVEDHGLTLYGKLPDRSDGLIVRFDRVEQSNARRTWLRRTAAGAAFTALGGWLVSMFRSH